MPHWQHILSKLLTANVDVVNVELVRDWSESQVLRLTIEVDSRIKIYYAKRAHSGFAAEAAAYRLASYTPGFPAPAGRYVPIGEGHWLILEEACGSRLADLEPQHYLQAAKCLAAFHELGMKEKWGNSKEFLDVSSHVRILLDTVSGDVRQAVFSGQFSGVDEQLLETTHAALVKHRPTLMKKICSLPTTLIHGDCHSGNTFVHNGEIHLVDWASASIAPGLLDLVCLIDVAKRMNQHISDTDVVTAYCSALSADTRLSYGNMDEAWATLCVVRALQELSWFTQTKDDYGHRSNRELMIILNRLRLTKTLPSH